MGRRPAWLIVFLASCSAEPLPIDAPDAGAGDTGNGSLDAARPDTSVPDAFVADAAPAEDAAVVVPEHASSFVAQIVPASVEANAPFEARVTMRNDGTAVWSLAAGYYLGSWAPMDNVTWGTSRSFMDGAASVARGETYEFVLALHAPAVAGTYTMRWKMLQDAVEWFGAESDEATVTVTERHMPTVDELRAFRGDFGGIYLQEIAPQCPEDPVTHVRCTGDNGATPRGLVAGELFTPAYGVYTDVQRAAIRAAYLQRGYTHFPISIFCDTTNWYHSLYPPMDCSHTEDWLRELSGDGLIPVCFVLGDGQTSRDLSGFDTSLCPIVVPEWEMNGPLNNDTQMINDAITFTRNAFPNALLYVHFTPEHAAGGEPEADWWNWATHDPSGPHVQGLLYQDDRWDDPQAVKDRVLDFLIRLGGGYHGWPNPVDVVMFESDIYTKFWDGRTEADGITFNDQILEYMRAPQCYTELSVDYCGQLIGFCSGGTP